MDRFSWKPGTSKLSRFPNTYDERISEDRSERGQPKILTGSVRLPQVSGTYGHAQSKDMTLSKAFFSTKSSTAEALNNDKMCERNETGDALFMSVVKRPRMYPKLESQMIATIRQPLTTNDVEIPVNPTQSLALIPEELQSLRHPFEIEARGAPNANSHKVRVSKSCPRPFTIERVPSVMNATK